MLPRFSKYKCKASSQHCYIFPTNITNKLQYIYSTALRFGCWVWTNFKVEMFVCCYLELPKNVNYVVSSLEKIWSFGNKNWQQEISWLCHHIKTLKAFGKNHRRSMDGSLYCVNEWHPHRWHLHKLWVDNAWYANNAVNIYTVISPVLMKTFSLAWMEIIFFWRIWAISFVC